MIDLRSNPVIAAARAALTERASSYDDTGNA